MRPGNMDESRDVAAQIEHGVELDGGLGLLERRPRKQRQAEVDGGGIERVDGVGEIDAKSVVGVQAPGDGDQGLGEVGVDAPVALLARLFEEARRGDHQGRADTLNQGEVAPAFYSKAAKVACAAKQENEAVQPGDDQG